jgi:NitT/TauT family transport system substrate-binding protein
MMRAATAHIRENPDEAARLASEWTKRPIEVESASVPNIVYVMDPGDEYRRGLETWFGIMKDIGKFQKDLKDATWDEAFERVHDLSLIQEAAASE